MKTGLKCRPGVLFAILLIVFMVSGCKQEPVFDHRNSILDIGGWLENIEIAGKNYGYTGARAVDNNGMTIHSVVFVFPVERMHYPLFIKNGENFSTYAILNCNKRKYESYKDFLEVEIKPDRVYLLDDEKIVSSISNHEAGIDATNQAQDYSGEFLTPVFEKLIRENLPKDEAHEPRPVVAE